MLQKGECGTKRRDFLCLSLKEGGKGDGAFRIAKIFSLRQGEKNAADGGKNKRGGGNSGSGGLRGLGGGGESKGSHHWGKTSVGWILGGENLRGDFLFFQ